MIDTRIEPPAQHQVEAAETPARQIVVPIRAHDFRRPLFLVHEASGNVMPYERLSHFLDGSLPIYGLQAVPSSSAADVTFEGLAKSYLQAIRGVQSHGPYRLAGWSIGGLIAYEMAHQLIVDGESVEFIGLIDTRADLGGQAAGDTSLDSLKPWRHHIERLGRAINTSAADSQLDLGAIQLAIDQCREAGWVSKQVTIDGLRSLDANIRTLSNAAMCYRPPCIPMRVHLFTARAMAGGDPSCGWKAVVGHRLQIETIGGTHLTVMKEPVVKDLAASLSHVLWRIDWHAASKRQDQDGQRMPI